jgi:hypothetical protein
MNHSAKIVFRENLMIGQKTKYTFNNHSADESFCHFYENA